MLVAIILPLIIINLVQTTAVVGAGGVIVGLADPKQRAEMVAKGILDPKDPTTKIPQDELGEEFKDAYKNDNSNNNSNNSNSNNANDKSENNNSDDTTGSGGIRQKIVQLAESRVKAKIPYSQQNPQQWDNHMDCSGLVQQVFQHAGLNMTRTTYTQIKECSKIDRNDAKPGDLCFFMEGGSPEHVAIYIGNNKFIEEPEPGECCHEINVYNMPGATQYWARPNCLNGK